ncbi:MAG: hypothetical protein O9336_11490 [Microcystis sp. LE19-98.1E]|nr:hypothetical protein [Microcystis sp. LE19-98.1E]
MVQRVHIQKPGIFMGNRVRFHTSRSRIYLDFPHKYLLQYPKTGSSGVCVEGRRIGIIWVHLNLVEISRGRFGRTQLRLPF